MKMELEMTPPPAEISSWTVSEASAADRRVIAGLRHEIYALELGQHPANADGQLGDALDGWNIMLVAKRGEEIDGFISVTPPGRPSYSIDKYFERQALPFAVDDRLYEIRLLTVTPERRGSPLAWLLMYTALRWVEAHGGARLVAIGRREVAELYRRVGMEPMELSVRSGAVTYDLMLGTAAALRAKVEMESRLLTRLEQCLDWRLPFTFRPPAPCFHGGAFFAAIGEKFDRLDRADSIINADVLDAWFPPAPGALAALRRHLPWLVRTSPPTQCGGLVEVIAAARGVAPEHILPGAGSSDLIFRALPHWLRPASRILLLDPTYGEYAHVLERVIGCRIDRFPLRRENAYELDLDDFARALGRGYDLAVVVNPNSPTGGHAPRRQLEALLRGAPQQTRIWIDETYVDFVGAGESLEGFAARSENAIVCKSMSKAYGLSGMRAAYLCAGRHQLESLRAITPPWVIGLPSQLAAVAALQDPEYYRTRYRETAQHRRELAEGLAGLGWDTIPGVANFILAHLPSGGPDAATLISRCAALGLHLRNAASMSPQLGARCVRLAVKDRPTNLKMLAILRQVLASA
ncbi:MAG TPA: histidinol-phosphate transaminase [Opitutaceae bacterium]|jgi:histidinol-phosphate/aromatic aminotransferase/cobyric acid decarboxylase-like protein/ribosomal protein S18 acetylase RimI-like enzyme|nr:histidinol-phosphate transaminase [Opitutaceae bacterium]